MEVNQEILQKLICSVCKEHLSVSPVILLQNGHSVCGRCPASNSNKKVVLRNLPYEFLAEQLLFPCRNAKRGCKVKCVFGKGLKHEEECEFRQFNCCISETSTCTWIGTKDELLQHCKDTHPLHVVQNPATFEYDILESYVNNYLMTAFQMLFLIHTKVCLTSKQIYHCVRLLGDSGNIANFDYSLMITKEDNKMTKKRDVAKQGCLAIKEDDSLAIGINNLLSLFSNIKGTTFTLSVNSFIEKSKPQINTEGLYCCKCGTNVTYTAAYFDEGKWFCSACIDNKHVCSIAGCSFMETKHKINVHEIYYCSYKRRCLICNTNIDVSLEQHYQKSHTNITYLCGEIFMAQFSRTNMKQFIITSDFGRLNCWYSFHSESGFCIYVFSPIDSGNLRWYTCELQLHNPDTKLTLRKILPLFDHEVVGSCDWRLEIDSKEIMQYVYNGQYKIAVTITKTK